jgi:hypothetical protein
MMQGGFEIVEWCRLSVILLARWRQYDSVQDRASISRHAVACRNTANESSMQAIKIHANWILVNHGLHCLDTISSHFFCSLPLKLIVGVVDNEQWHDVDWLLFQQVAMESNRNPKMDVMLLRIKDESIVVVRWQHRSQAYTVYEKWINARSRRLRERASVCSHVRTHVSPSKDQKQGGRAKDSLPLDAFCSCYYWIL